MSDTPTSPLLTLPGAVAGNGIDAGVAAHYGSFNGEQRTLEAGDGFVDLSHRDVLRISGPDRLTWLHDLTTQHLARPGARGADRRADPEPAGPRRARDVRHRLRRRRRHLHGAHRARPRRGAADFLLRMRFMSRVEVEDATAELAVAWRPAARTGVPYDGYEFVPRDRLAAYAEAAGPAAGFWAFEALRIARGEPRLGLDTDHRTIPNEAGWIGNAVHLDKGCYRGQETVARVHTLGRPPRRLTLLHLDGSENLLPEVGSELRLGEKVVGHVGTSARHHELGPIALALVKRNVAAGGPAGRRRAGRRAGDCGGSRSRTACPAYAAGVSWEGRLAWLLRAWRLHQPDSPFHDPAAFSRALASHGCPASPDQILAWESGLADPPYGAWIGYERALGLRHCALASCREYLRVFLPAGSVPRLTGRRAPRPRTRPPRTSARTASGCWTPRSSGSVRRSSGWRSPGT